MANVSNKPGFTPRFTALAALAAGATALGLMAIGWITIEKFRPFARPLR